MAVCLSGLPTPQNFDTVGEPGTLQQRWKLWTDEFELYCIASGVKDTKQQRALLLHLAGAGIREIFNAFTSEQKGEDYKTAMESLTDHFKLKKNIPMARQVFLTAKPKPGERIHNFITRLQTLAEDCDYSEEKDNQIRDRVITFIKDKHLKAKLYREDSLTLSKLLDVVTTYHDKEALILVPEAVVNNLRSYSKQEIPSKFQGRCYRCNKPGHKSKDCICSQKHVCGKCGKTGHFEVCCSTKQFSGKPAKSAAGQKNNKEKKQSHTVRLVESKNNQAIGEPNDVEDYYVFCTDENQSPNTLKLLIADKPLDNIVDSGASCNLMSEETFNF